MSDPKNYTIGWICAITPEYVAAQCFLDERHDEPDYLSPRNTNDYTLGRIGKHNVVISALPLGSQGSASAAQVAENMLHSFPNVRIGLLVGTGGGVPLLHDVRLGDVVVSIPSDGGSGVIQYDFGKMIQGQGFQPTGFLNQPPTILRAAVGGLKAQYEVDGHSLKENVEEVFAKKPKLGKRYKRPEAAKDRLYKSGFVHPLPRETTGNYNDESNNLIPRDPRLEDEDDPVIHYGSLASANQLMNDALIRDKFARERNILCFEMEAAGLMNNFPCLVIRGICNYADSHTEVYTEWRGYAAMIAAAYAKDLLLRISPQHVQAEKKIVDILKFSIDNIIANTDRIAETTGRIERSLVFDKLPLASGAEYNSYADQYEVECLDGTRTDLLRQVKEWASSLHGKCLFWLNGMAGTGKSTISRTVARSLKENLGASFFFKRGEGDRGNAKKLFSTLIQQLVLQCPVLVPGVQKALEADPNLASKSLCDQFNRLLLQPLLGLDDSGQQDRQENIVMVLDALDECDHDGDVRTIIQLLARLQQVRTIRIRVFLTSRPELPIRLGFKKIKNQDYQDLVLHEIAEEVTKHDISLFLHDRFEKIRIERDVPYNWPSGRAIRDLIKMSVPLFISAATVCRYIEHSKLEPTTRLRELLQDQTRYANRMDKTYMPILNRLVNDIESREEDQQEILRDFQRIIGAIVLLAIPLSIPSLSKLLNIETKILHAHLDSFQSVLSVPKITEPNKPVRILHLSFRDFLTSSSETKFRVDEKIKNREISEFCFKRMKLHLKKNMCKLEHPATERTSIDPECISRLFPPELSYACRYWVYHFEKGKILKEEVVDLLLFLKEHFLHWVEAMSLLGLTAEVVGSINTLQMAISAASHQVSLHECFTRISDFLHDANRFILRIRQVLEKTPLQIYCSGLIFTPRTSIVRRQFEKEIPDWICQLPQVSNGWAEELQSLKGHSGPVKSIVFSPDGQLFASGSLDKKVQIWDTTTDAMQRTLEGPGSVESVAFSPDGRLIACTFTHIDVRQIRLFDPITGSLEQTIESPSSVLSVAFSADGLLLASGNIDKKVRLWDLETGQVHREFEGRDRINSVSFSPNGKLFAFSSVHPNRLRDQIKNRAQVQLWDLETGLLKESIEEPGDVSYDVIFSPDSSLLAFAIDHTIHIWDLTAGAKKQVFADNGNVNAIAFSSDGLLLASGNANRGRKSSAHIWDLENGELHSLGNRGFFTSSVAFAPGKRLLATGHWDHIVRLWDPALKSTQTQVQLDGHGGAIRSVAFSPDGKLLISSADDYNIHLWDTATGSLHRTFKHELYGAQSIRFSSDGQTIAFEGPNGGDIWLLDLPSGIFQRQRGVDSNFLDMAFSCHGHFLACFEEDDGFRVLNVTTGVERFILNMEVGLSANFCAWELALSPNSQLLAVGFHETMTVHVWDAVTGEEKQKWVTETQFVELKFSHDSFYLCNQDGTLLSGQAFMSIWGQQSPEIFAVVDEWLELNNERLLWLGNQLGLETWAIRDNVIALGHMTGQVSFLRLENMKGAASGSEAWMI